MLKMSNKNYYKFAKCSTLWPFCSDIVQKLWRLFCLQPPKMPKFFELVQNFVPNKNLFMFSAGSKLFVPDQKVIFHCLKSSFGKFCIGSIHKSIFRPTKKVWICPKHFGTCKRKKHISVTLVSNASTKVKYSVISCSILLA